jgi:hypothetical protein
MDEYNKVYCEKCHKEIISPDTLHETANDQYICSDCYSSDCDYVYEQIKDRGEL